MRTAQGRAQAGTEPALLSDVHVASSSQAVDPGARIGPNAPFQTLRAVRELHGEAVRVEVAAACGLNTLRLDQGLVLESSFVDLVAHLRDRFGFVRAQRLLAMAGRFTGAYVAHHRIPAWLRWGFEALPSRVALKMLLDGVQRHAWTFAGAGRFHVSPPYPYRLVLEDHPCCRGPGPGFAGDYYTGAFETLVRLAVPAARVEEIHCRRETGGQACVFRISPPQPSVASSASVAS